MTNPTLRQLHLADVPDLYNDIYNGTLPPVSFVEPSGWVDGHPASSKLDLFEGFVKKIITEVRRTRRFGLTLRSSSPSTKAEANTIPVTFSRLISA